MGFEPTISTLTGWRAQPGCSARASFTLADRPAIAREGFEPSASLTLNESGLPVAYRAISRHVCSLSGGPGIQRTAQGGIRTHRHPGLSRAAQPIGVPGPRFQPGPERSPSSSDAEAVGLEPTSGLCRHLFSRQAPDPAGSLPSIDGSCLVSSQFRGLESNQRPPRSERGVTTNSNCPGFTHSPIREGGFEPPPPDSKSGSLPVSRFPIWSLLISSLSARVRASVLQSGIGDLNPGCLVGSQESCRWTNPAGL
jgi:hypothetical protein